MSTQSSDKAESERLLRAAITLHGAGRLEEAYSAYRSLLSYNPSVAAAWINLGVLLRRRGHPEAAIYHLRRGLAIKPDDGPAWSNLANALRAANRLDEALAAHKWALEFASGTAQLHYNYGLCLRDRGELNDALRAFRRAELLGYTKAELYWDQALTHLLKGEFHEGFTQYEARWQLPGNHARHTDITPWRPPDIGDTGKDVPDLPIPLDLAPLDGKTLLVWSEQGFGDTIQFSRYVLELQRRATKAGIKLTLVFEVQASLADLFRMASRFKGVTIVEEGESLVGAAMNATVPPPDLQVPLLSLPRILGTTLETIPADTPYLDAPEDGTAKRLSDRHFHIGIIWAGKPSHRNDRNRSVKLPQFGGLLDIPDVQVHALQVPPRSEEINQQKLDALIHNMGEGFADFRDTAAAVQALDLVIAVDTSVAHLAGALGKPVWTLLPYSPDWRWMVHRDTSPWYPTMTLFRQTSPGDWDEVFARLRAALTRRLAAHGRLGSPFGGTAL